MNCVYIFEGGIEKNVPQTQTIKNVSTFCALAVTSILFFQVSKSPVSMYMKSCCCVN